jgi:uncharacterized membrane protein YbhN (UPF0104 family)
VSFLGPIRRLEIPPSTGNVRRSSNRFGHFATLLKVSIGIVIVAVIWSRVMSGRGDFSDLGGFSWFPAIVCLLLLPANFLLDVRVWRTLLAGAGVSLFARDAARAVLAGFSAAAISPGGVGDFVGRVIRIPTGKRWITGFAMALGRAADGAIICVVGVACALTILPLASDATDLWIRTVIAIACPMAVLLLAVYCARGSMNWLSKRLRRWPSLLHALNLATAIPVRYRVEAFLWASARYAVFTTQFVLALLAFGGDTVGLPTLFAGTAAVYLLRNVAPPLTFMGLGIREAASVAVLGQLGVPESSALFAALLVFAINLALPALIGIPYLLSSHRTDAVQAERQEVSHV